VQKKCGFPAQTSIVAAFIRKRFSRFAAQFLPQEIQTAVGGVKKHETFFFLVLTLF